MKSHKVGKVKSLKVTTAKRKKNATQQNNLLIIIHKNLLFFLEIDQEPQNKE
jgi:hypothetical protein